MSRRQNASLRPAKRQRNARNAPAFGAPSEEDLPASQTIVPTPMAASVRPPTYTSVPPLTTLCARVFATNVMKLRRRETLWNYTKTVLAMLPEIQVAKVFALLREHAPVVLDSAFIGAFFLRGSSVTLTGELPGATRDTLRSIRGMGESLRDLELRNFASLADTIFAALIAALPRLRKLILSGCTKVGNRTTETAASHCTSLAIVNFDYTSVMPVGLAPLLMSCTELQTLKVAGVPNWNDAGFAKLLIIVQETKDFKLPHLRTLKLRQTALSEVSMHQFIPLCPNLERLDLSFTSIRHVPPFPSGAIPPLVKLSLNSTDVPGSDVIDVVSQLPHLRKLRLGALGGAKAATSQSTMTAETLDVLTDILENYKDIEDVSLANNKFLSQGNGALTNFIRRVGRKCKSLNLAGIPSLSSDNLISLIPDTGIEDGPQIQQLNLRHTKVGDESAPYVAACTMLKTLDLSQTRITSEGLFEILHGCPDLQHLDLTMCRGVKLGDRRRFFEIWEKERRLA